MLRRLLASRVLKLAGVAAVMAARSPELLRHPRFWAEEGSVYLASAWRLPWLEALLAPHRGYYSLVPNAATLLAARAVPLEHAPAVTTVLGLLVQLAPAAVILWGRSVVWRCPVRQALGVLLVLLVSPDPLTWLTTLSAHTHLGVAAMLLLLEPWDGMGPRRRLAARTLLAVAAATGAVACFLAPAFLARAWRERSRDAVVAAAILAAGALAQAGAALSSAGGGTLGHRFGGGTMAGVAGAVVRDGAVGAILGPHLGAVVWSAGGAPRLLAVVLSVALLGFLLGDARPEPRRALLAFGLLGVLSTVASIRMEGGTRYALAPSMALLVATLAQVELPARSARSRAALGVVLLAVATWAAATPRLAASAVRPGWPRWSEQVARWREDPARMLAIWPQYPGRPGWWIRLGPAPAAGSHTLARPPEVGE